MNLLMRWFNLSKNLMRWRNVKMQFMYELTCFWFANRVSQHQRIAHDILIQAFESQSNALAIAKEKEKKKLHGFRALKFEFWMHSDFVSMNFRFRRNAGKHVDKNETSRCASAFFQLIIIVCRQKWKRKKRRRRRGREWLLFIVFSFAFACVCQSTLENLALHSRRRENGINFLSNESSSYACLFVYSVTV